MKEIKIDFSKIWKGAKSTVKGLGALAFLAFLLVNFTLTTSELAENAVAAKKPKPIDPVQQALETNFYHDLLSSHLRPLFREIELDPSEQYHIGVSYYDDNQTTTLTEELVREEKHGDFYVVVWVKNARGTMASGPNRGWYDFVFKADYRILKRVPSHKDRYTRTFRFYVQDVTASLKWLRYFHEETGTSYSTFLNDHLKKEANISYTRASNLAKENKFDELKARDAADRIFQYLELDKKLQVPSW